MKVMHSQLAILKISSVLNTVKSVLNTVKYLLITSCAHMYYIIKLYMERKTQIIIHLGEKRFRNTFKY